MQECGPRLNIIAAIVVMGCSDGVTESFRHLLEPLQQRRLWTGEWDYARSTPGADETGNKKNPYLPSWLWVYDGRNWTTGFTDFRSRLTDAVEADGFKIEFVELHGPRYLAGMNEMPSRTRWVGCNNILVCDHFDAGFPPRIKGCSDWTDAVIAATDADIENYKRDNRDVFLTQARDSPEIVQLLVASKDGNSTLAAERPAPIKMCHVLSHPERTIKFVPTTKIKRRLEAYRLRVPGSKLNPDMSTSRLVRQVMLDYTDERVP